jgi:hypothetical protein
MQIMKAIMNKIRGLGSSIKLKQKQKIAFYPK